ncbi:hypothetical protein WL48_30530 [Burkholderia ubonensis]|uniref:phage tail fiber protein n=1 Tax=Burkholderia ubonensis TaxID=101571 RepID=UPI00075DAF34|nr:tail fiber domain-containing protein [Burkholderia ubonensis]KWC24808.1 hypothetical protein WL48_30530 [Burkholderia ubonensis]KWC35163.1 hypothetical protein WL49_02340 [Burkholderia ubonensis]
MEGLQELDFGKEPTGEGGDTYRKAAKKIQANFDAISAAMDTKADAGGGAGSLADERDSRVRGDADTLAAAKLYATAEDAKVTTAANARMDSGDASTLLSAKDDATIKDSAVTAAANARMDKGDAAATAAANTRMDNGDANTLASAKTYADGVGAARLADAKAHSDAQDAKVTSEAHAYADDKASKAQSNATNAAKAYTDDQISALVGDAPEVLNTLNEIAAALNDDANYAATVTAQLAAKADTTAVDAKDASILAQAKAYTDESPASGTPKSYVDAGDANMLAGAKAYTDSLAKGDIQPSSVSATGHVKGAGSNSALIASNGGGAEQTSIMLTREAAPTDQKRWEILHGTAGDFQIRTISDSYTSAHSVLYAKRAAAGTGVDYVGIAQSGARVSIGATADNGSDALQVSGTADFTGGKITISRTNGEGEIWLGQNDGYYYANASEAGWYSPTQGTFAYNFAAKNVRIGSDYVWHAGNVTPLDKDVGGEVNGPIVQTAIDYGGNGGQFRAVYGNYGTFMRNDGATCYLMQTAANDQRGAWNSYRPFQWSLEDGSVKIADNGSQTQTGGDLVVRGGRLLVGGTSYDSGNNASIASDGNIWGVQWGGQWLRTFLDTTYVHKSGDTIAGRINLSGSNWQADFGMRSGNNDNTWTYLRARQGGGIDLINNAYNMITWAVDDWGNMFTRGMHVMQPNGNLFCQYRNAWMSDILNDLYNRDDSKIDWGNANARWNSSWQVADHLFEARWDGNSGHINMFIDHTFVAYVARNVSDMRLKTNIAPTPEDSLGKVNALAFKQFDWRRDGKQQRLGLIAQQAKAVDESFVYQPPGDPLDPTTSPMVLDTNALLLTALHAVQQLSAEVSALKAQSTPASAAIGGAEAMTK